MQKCYTRNVCTYSDLAGIPYIIYYAFGVQMADTLRWIQNLDLQSMPWTVYVQPFSGTIRFGYAHFLLHDFTALCLFESDPFSTTSSANSLPRCTRKIEPILIIGRCFGSSSRRVNEKCILCSVYWADENQMLKWPGFERLLRDTSRRSQCLWKCPHSFVEIKTVPLLLFQFCQMFI